MAGAQAPQTGAEEGSDADESALSALACRVLKAAQRSGKSVATAESCTGGLIAALLTDQQGYSKWFDRGFVAYTDEAKQELLGVPRDLIARHGAVSAPVAHALARGGLVKSRAGIAVGVTGFAGEAGPDDEPGLVFLSVVDRQGHCATRECHFGDIGRDHTRNRAARTALDMLESVLKGRFRYESPVTGAFAFAGHGGEAVREKVGDRFPAREEPPILRSSPHRTAR